MSETALNLRPVDHNQIVAANVRAEAARRGLTQAQVAAQLAVSEMWVSRRFAGTTTISANDIVLFADFFKVSFDTLFAGTRTPVGGGSALHAVGDPLRKGWKLPDLDSNQEPIVFTPDAPTAPLAQLEEHRRAKQDAHHDVLRVRGEDSISAG